MWRNPSVFSQSPSKTVGSFPWRDSSSPPWIGFGFCGGCGEGPLDGSEGGVGGRGGEGPRSSGGKGDCFGIWNFLRIVTGVLPNWFHASRAQPSILLTNGGDVMSAGCRARLGSSFRVIVGDTIGSSFIDVEGLVVTNFHSYGDSIDRGSVSSGVGSARNIHRCRSLVQYHSIGVDRCSSSSFFIRATGSARIAS